MKKYRVGIIGCGAIFVMHGASLKAMNNTEVEAVCDIKKEAADMAGEYLGCRVYYDYTEMLADPDIDSVHVLTPHHLHHRIAIDAMKAGKHVLVEKPMAINEVDAEEMNRVSKVTGKTLGVISQNRFNAASKAIKEILETGELGAILSAKVVLTWAKPDEYYKNSEWRGTWDKEGGSLLIDQAVHVLDQARWFMDSNVESIEARLDNRMHPDIETEDTAEGVIRFENGAYMMFFASNCYSTNSPVTIEFHCEGGLIFMEFDTAVISYNNGRETRISNDPADSFEYGEFKGFMGEQEMGMAMEATKSWGLAQVPMPATWKQPKMYWGFSHIRQIQDFYESIKNNKSPAIDGVEAIKTQKMIFGIYESSRLNSKIKFLK